MILQQFSFPFFPSKQQYIPLSYFCPVKCQSNQYQIKYSYKITDSVGLFVEPMGNTSANVDHPSYDMNMNFKFITNTNRCHNTVTG